MKNKGFTIVEMLAIILLVGVLAGTGYFITHRQHKTVSQIESPPLTQRKASDITSTWLTFNHPSGDYSVKLVDGWHYTLQDNGLLFLQCTKDSVTECTYSANSHAIINNVSGGRDGVVGLFIIDGDGATPSGQNFGTIKASNISGQAYQQVTADDGVGLGPPKGSVITDYYFEKGSKKVMVEYQIPPGATDNTALVKKMISTLAIH